MLALLPQLFLLHLFSKTRLCRLLRPSAGGPEADVGQSLARLQAQVTTMQEQLTELALALLRERELRLECLQERQQHTEERLGTLEALLPLAAEPSPSP